MGDRCMLRSPSGLGGMKHGVLQSSSIITNVSKPPNREGWTRHRTFKTHWGFHFILIAC